MPWYIMRHGKAKPVEALRSEGEAKKVLAEYGDHHYITFSPSCNLQAIRVARRMSQAELSEASGIPVGTIRKFESLQKSINRASVDTVLKLAKALNTSIEKILEPSE